MVHTNDEPATAATTGGPRKDAARARTDAGLGDTTASVREQLPAARPWCGPGPPGGEDVAPVDTSSGWGAGRAAQRSLVQRVRLGPTPG